MIRKLVSTCFYVGCAPGAPGTYGSLAAVAIALVLLQFDSPATAGIVLLGLAALLTFVGARLGSWAESYYGKTDPSQFVLDEVVGCFAALGPVLMIFPDANLLPKIGLPFLFFRVFDVIKPFPAGKAELVPGGWGIMLDDLVAACYAVAASVAGILLFCRW